MQRENIHSLHSLHSFEAMTQNILYVWRTVFIHWPHEFLFGGDVITKRKR